LDEVDHNNPEQMNGEEDVDQYEQKEMKDEEDTELAILPGEGKNIGLIESIDNQTFFFS